MGYEDKGKVGRTLNPYKSVWFLNDRNSGTLFGNSNCSPGLQHSTKPPTSAEMTELDQSLYYFRVSDYNRRSLKKSEEWIENAQSSNKPGTDGASPPSQVVTITTTIVQTDGTRLLF